MSAKIHVDVGFEITTAAVTVTGTIDIIDIYGIVPSVYVAYVNIDTRHRSWRLSCDCEYGYYNQLSYQQ